MNISLTPLKEHIATNHGGNQTEYAKKHGYKQQSVCRAIQSGKAYAIGTGEAIKINVLAQHGARVELCDIANKEHEND